MIKEVTEKIKKTFPNIYFSTCGTLSMWVKRDGKDAEAINIPEDEKKVTLEWLKGIDKECVKAKREGWFFCSDCNKANPMKDYADYLWSGKYCKSCVAKDGELAQEIKRSKSSGYYD